MKLTIHMSLINCPECNKQNSDKAEACPYCGLPGSFDNFFSCKKTQGYLT